MTTKNGDEDWHTPVLPKKFQNLANIDEYFLTADCLDNEIAADLSRFKWLMWLGRIQCQDLGLQNEKNLPIAQIPCHNQLFAVISRLAAQREKLFIEYQSYDSKSEFEHLEYLYIDLPRAMHLHGNQLSASQKADCLGLLQLSLTQARFNDSCVLEMLDERLDLVVLYSKIKLSKQVGLSQKFMQIFAGFPFEHTKCSSTSLKDFIQNPPIDLINLQEYLGDFASFEALRSDQRPVWEIAKSMVDEKTSFDAQIRLVVGLWWNRVVKDEISLREAVRSSFIVYCHQRILRKAKDKTIDKVQPDQLFEVLKSTEDIELVKSILHFIKRNFSEFGDYFKGQLPDNSDDLSQKDYEQSDLYVLLKQICSVRIVASEGNQDQSAFEEEISIQRGQGPLMQSAALNPKIQQMVIHLVQTCVPKLFSQKHQNHFLAIYRETLQLPLVQVGDRQILQISMFKIVNLVPGIASWGSRNTSIHEQQVWFENLIETWINYLAQEVFWPPVDNYAEPTEVDFKQKCVVIATLLLSMCQDYTGIARAGDFGDRIISGKLLGLFDAVIVPLAAKKDTPCDKVISAFCHLVTICIETQINCINQLNKTDQNKSSFIQRLIQVMSDWYPTELDYCIKPKITHLDVVLRFLAGLSLTETGRPLVVDNGYKLLQIVLNAPESSYFQPFDSKKPQLHLNSNSSIAQLCKRVPNALLAIKDEVSFKISASQIIANELKNVFLEYQRELNCNAKTAGYLLKIQNRSQIDQLMKNLRIIEIPESEQREGTTSFDASIAVFSTQGYILERQTMTVGGLLNQMSAIFMLLETTSYLYLGKASDLLLSRIQFVAISVEEGGQNDDGVFDPVGMRPIVQRLQQATTVFDQVTKASKCSTFEELMQKSDQLRQEFVNFNLWQFMLRGQTKLGQLFDLCRETKLSLHIAHLLSYRSTQLAQKVFNSNAGFGQFSQQFCSQNLPQTPDLKAYESLLQQFKELQQQLVIEVNMSLGSYSFVQTRYFCKDVETTAKRRHVRGLPGNSVQETASKNLVSLGESLAEMTKRLSNQDQLMNLSIVTLAAQFLVKTDTDLETVAFINKGGLKSLCQLYRSLLIQESSLPQNEGQTGFTMEQAINKCVFYDVKIQVAHILNSILCRQLHQPLKDEQIKLYTGFDTHSSFVMNTSQIALTELLQWDSDQHDVELILLPRSLEQAQDSLLFDLLLRMLMRPEPARQDRRDPREPPDFDEREPTEEQVSQVTALGFDRYMAVNALKMSRLSPEHAIECLLTNPDGLFRFIEQKNQEKQKREMEKVLRSSSKQLSAADMVNKLTNYLPRLVKLLFAAKINTQINQVDALAILKAIKDLHFIPDFEVNDGYTAQIKLLMLQKGRFTEFSLSQLQEMLKNGTSGFAEEDLFWIAQLLDHLAKKDLTVYKHMLDYNIQVLQSDCPQEARELTMVTLVRWLQSMPLREAQPIAARLVPLMTKVQSPLVNRIFVIALHSQEGVARCLDTELKSLFQSMNQIQQSLQAINKLEKTEEFSRFAVTDICQYLQEIGDAEQIKQAIANNCTAHKVNNQLLLAQKPYQMYSQNIAQESDQLFSLGLERFESQSNEVSDNLMPGKYLNLTYLFSLTQVYPHLLTQISDKFLDNLVRQISECKAENSQATICDLIQALVGCSHHDQSRQQFQVKLLQSATELFEQSSEGLDVILALVQFENRFEWNRVTVSAASYFKAIETLALESKFLKSLALKLGQLDDQKVKTAVEILKACCAYLEIQKNRRSVKQEPEEQQDVVIAEVEFELDAENEAALSVQLNEQHQEEASDDDYQDEEANDDGDDDQGEDEEEDDDGEGDEDEEQEDEGVLFEEAVFGQEMELIDEDEQEEESEDESARQADLQPHDIMRRPVHHQRGESSQERQAREMGLRAMGMPEELFEHLFPHLNRNPNRPAPGSNWSEQERLAQWLLHSLMESQSLQLSEKQVKNRPELRQNKVKPPVDLQFESNLMSDKFMVLRASSTRQLHQIESGTLASYQKKPQPELQRFREICILHMADKEFEGAISHPRLQMRMERDMPYEGENLFGNPAAQQRLIFENSGQFQEPVQVNVTQVISEWLEQSGLVVVQESQNQESISEVQADLPQSVVVPESQQISSNDVQPDDLLQAQPEPQNQPIPQQAPEQIVIAEQRLSEELPADLDEQLVPAPIEESKEELSSIQQEASAFEQHDQEEQKQAEEPSSYGIPHSVLFAHDIDPAMLDDLPEELRDELIASIDWRPQQQQQVALDPQFQLDQDFFNSMPEDIRQEILESERRRIQAEQALAQAAANGARPAEIDIATFIQTLEDPRAREEALLSLEPEQLAQLPPGLRAEAGQMQERMNQRIAQQRELHRMMDQRHNPVLANRGMGHQQEPLDQNSSNQLNQTMNIHKKLVLCQSQDQIQNLILTPNECFYSRLFLNKDLPQKTDLIETKIAELDLVEQLFSKMIEFTITGQKSDTIVTKYDIVGLLGLLSKLRQNQKYAIRDQILSKISSQITANLQDLQANRIMPQTLMLLTVVRILVKQNRKAIQRLLLDFMNEEKSLIGLMLSYLLSEIQEKDLSSCIQITLSDIFAQAERWIEKEALKFDCDIKLKQLLAVMCGQITPQLQERISGLLTKASLSQQDNWAKICELSTRELNLCQEQVIQVLEQTNQMIQESGNQHQEADKRLNETKVLLQKIRAMSQLMRFFEEASQDFTADIQKATNDNKGSTRHILALSQTMHLLHETKSATILRILADNLLTVFQVGESELLGMPSEQQTAVQLQPIHTDETQVSERRQLADLMFRADVELSDFMFHFCKMCHTNRDLINRYLDSGDNSQSHRALLEQMSLMPRIFNFKRKQSYFRSEIMKGAQRYLPRLHLVINRKNIFIDAYAQLSHKTVSELRGPLHVDYTGEVGVDAGGLTRDFYIELSRQLFNPNYSLFAPASNGVSFHPNQQSHVNPDHLNFFQFIGRVIGKALFDDELLELHFSKPLYKMMVGEDLTFADLQDLDNDFYRSCVWTMQENCNDLGLTFAVNRDYFGRLEQQNLVENGNQIQVNNENKIDYLQKLSLHKMYTAVKAQVDAFLKGFHELIPKKLVGIFTASELDLLISGLPKVDLNDLRINTEFRLYTSNSPQVLWLWRCLESFSQEEIGRFLQFVTGCSRVPLSGFANLQGMSGTQKFNIVKVSNSARLPQGHTCFNSLDLPEYDSYEILREKLHYAIMNTGGFGFA